MTWAELAELIMKMSPTERNSHIAILIGEEVYSGVDANLLINTNLLDQLDHGHPYLEINTNDPI